MDIQKLFYKYLEAELEELFGKLKPELKNKFTFCSTRNGNNKWGAATYRMVIPPQIEIHINSLEETYRPQLIKSMKWLISHEIIHTFQHSRQPEIEMENEAYKKQAIMKFFNEN